MDFFFASSHPVFAFLSIGNTPDKEHSFKQSPGKKPEEKHSRIFAPALPFSCLRHKDKNNILIMQIL